MQGKLLSSDDNPKARKVSQTSLLSQTSLQLKGKDSILQAVRTLITKLLVLFENLFKPVF
ncbi:TPA: hypothetical protein VUZ97_000854 [Streptococcus pneumoniae]|nr:hypothetical protein [Streptococcus pneumoniae]HEU0453412.1 hypothetical protein [Streptococcus pneumoniae]HEU0469628.1 hypothetical protein [Streptococcus pneumoniae]HEU0471520.1 hypothetical protein [Streptococcus pneumoniae]HEU1291368.1 hypothetical protein [Streptococcus pneumoniae]